MKTITEIVSLTQSTKVVFDFLSKVENLPKWATEYCTAVREENGRYLAETAFGPMITRHVAHEATGVIDMFSGGYESEMALFPVRVFSLPGGETVVSFTCFHAPDLSDEVFAQQQEALKRELSHLDDVIRRHHSELTPTPLGSELILFDHADER